MKFRALRADEIEARVSIVKQTGVVLLLYKDARCDMNILDETVGSFNWQRSHSRENANCTVSIWDEGKQQWISKEDTGTESFTEKEKGLASDSFKRACFNWGIGRELYTAPFIWISADHCKIEKKGNGHTCYDRFSVRELESFNGRITRVTIVNEKTGKVCYKYGNQASAPAPADPNQELINKVNSLKIDGTKWNALISMANKKGVDTKAILLQYKLHTPSEMTIVQWNEICARLNKMKDIGGKND